MAEYEISQFAGLVVQRSSALNPGSLTELTNAGVDTDGVIRSRAGAIRINVAQNNDGLGSTNVHSTALFGDVRYTGVGTVVRRGYEPTDPAIITGLNGNRVDFMHMAPSPAANNKKFTYFANAQTGARKKDDGTTVSNWGIDGPTASAVNAITPTVGASQPATTAIDSFASAYTAQDGFGSETAASNPYDTSARQFTVPAGKVERFRRTGLTLNLSTQGETGFVRIMLRVNNRQNLTHVEVALSTDTGAFTNDYYTTRIRALDFTADATWQEFKIPKSSFTRVKATGGSTETWSTVDGVQITVGANGKGQVIVSADDARVEADTHAQGTKEYKITLWNDNLKIRSNSRRLADVYAGTLAITGQITVNRQRITIARPSDSASWDAQVTHWELWRRDQNISGEFFFVARTAVANASYNDDFSDLALGEALVEDQHLPPAAKHILEYDGAAWFIGMNNSTSGSGEEESAWAVRHSRRSYPESVPLTNYVIVGTPTDIVHAGAIWANNLYLFTQEKVKRIQGQGGAYIAVDTEAPIGTISGYSVSSSPHGIFYRALDGVYLFTGGTSQKVSEDIDPIFHRETVVLDGMTLYPMDGDSVAEAEAVVGAYANGRYMMTYTDTNGTRTTLFFDLQKRRWHRAQNTTAGSGWAIQRLRWEKGGTTQPSDNLEAGTSDGWFVKLDSAVNQAAAVTDGGSAAIPFAVQTKAFDTELKPAKLDVDLKNVVVDIDTGGQSLTVQISLDGAAYVSLGTISTASRDKVYLPVNNGVGTVAYRVAVRISGNLSTARVSVFGIGLNYLPEPPRITEFSTDFTMLEWPGKKYLQTLTLEANTFGVNVVVSVEADGAVLGQTFTLNCNGRLTKTFSFNLPEPLAVEVRLRFDPTGSQVEWKLYSFDFTTLKEPLEVSRIMTEKNDEGWPGEKLFKNLAVEIDDLGTAVTAEMFIDDVSVGTFTTPGTAKRDTYYFSLASDVNLERRGSVWHATFSSAATFRLYRVWADHDREPIRNTFYKTAISDAGYGGEKRFRGLHLDIDTFGANCTIVPYVDGVAQTGLVGATFSTVGRKDIHVSIPDVRGRNVSLTLASGSATQFAFYSVSYDYEQEGWTSTYHFTQHVDAGYAGEKRFRTINLDVQTFGATVTLTPYIDGVAQVGLVSSVFTTTGRRMLHISIPDVRGRLIAITLESNNATRFIFYNVQYDYEPEGLTSTYWFNQWSDEGHPAPKQFQQVMVDLDTRASNVTLRVDVDQSNVHSEVVNTNGRLIKTISLPTTPEGKLIRVTLESAATVRFLVYPAVRYKFVPRPLDVTFWDTTPQHPFLNSKGWLRRGVLRIKNSTVVSGEIHIDGTLVYSFTIAAGGERVVRVPNPIGLTGSIVRLTLTSAQPFQCFPDSVWELHSLDADRQFESWKFVQ